MMNERKEYINKTESTIVINRGFSMEPGHRAYLPVELAERLMEENEGLVELKEKKAAVDEEPSEEELDEEEAPDEEEPSEEEE